MEQNVGRVEAGEALRIEKQKTVYSQKLAVMGKFWCFWACCFYQLALNSDVGAIDQEGKGG